MPRSLRSHPHWRQLTAIAVGLPVIAVLAVLAFAWPSARLAPRDLPVGVVTGPASQRVVAGLDAARPGGFDLHAYADDGAARTAIEHREVYGALEVTPQGLTVLTASAASPIVSQLLDAAGQQLGAAAKLGVTTVDVVPLADKDPRGVVFTSALLPLTICSVLAASVIAIALRFRPAFRQLSALVVVSATIALGIYLIAQTFLGAFPHNAVGTWAVLALIVLAMSSIAAGCVAVFGDFGVALAAAAMVLVGNPFSGATSAPELLPDAARGIGAWLPPGAGASLLRDTTYFDGHGGTGHLIVLLVWVIVGAAAVIIGHAVRARSSQRAPQPGSTAAAPVPAG